MAGVEAKAKARVELVRGLSLFDASLLIVGSVIGSGIFLTPGLIAADHPVTVNAVSGYSGGGKSMIASFEGGTAPSFELYGLGFDHKHIPEMQLYSKLSRRPLFVPSVGNFRQGMLVSVPLQLDTLPGKPAGTDLHAALVDHVDKTPQARRIDRRELVATE